MLRVALTIAALLCAPNTTGAHRVLEYAELTGEFALSRIEVPTSAAGTVRFTACDACPTRTVRVTSATRYFVNGTELSFADFSRVVEEIRAVKDAEQRTLTGLFFDVAAERVTRLALRSSAR